MWKIMKKNASFFLTYLIIVFLIISILRVLIGSKFNVIFAVFSGMSFFFLVFGAILMNEQYEEKHRGYAFLDMLPIKDSEIVRAKFILALLINCILTGFLVALFSFSSAGPDQLILVRSYFLANASICLLSAAVMLIGILRLGYTKFLVLLLSVTVALSFVPIIITKFYRDSLDVFISKISGFLTHVNWLIVIPLVLVFYTGMMQIATMAKKARRR
jgi:hypothetical protein